MTDDDPTPIVELSVHLHVAERADALLGALAPVLVEPDGDPFSPAVVAVPTRGVERWLAQRLSHTLGAGDGASSGVSANIDFPFPRALVEETVQHALGIEDDDPWTGSRTFWPLLEVVDSNLAEPWLTTLAAHLGGADLKDEPRRSRRGGVVRHIAGLYDRYAIHRPDMLRAWALGREEDGTGNPLPAEALWQARLWAELRTRIGSPSPPERIEDACGRLREDPHLSDLPRCLAVFGITRFPSSYLEVLGALAEHREVHLCVLHPSRKLWQELAIADPNVSARRADDETLERVRHPILASWGHDSRELQVTLSAIAAEEHLCEIDRETGSLLSLIQRDIGGNKLPSGFALGDASAVRPELDPLDNSIGIHACHGRMRQVEVLRDAIMHLLSEDPSLEPRDVIVMCPDVEDFAPLIHAVFGSGQVAVDDDDPEDLPIAGGRPDLRVRLADRGARRTNPMLAALSNLLALAPDRLTASQLLDFANLEPVRRRYSFSDDDLSRILEWINESCIHWGIDIDDRTPFHVKIDDGTWRKGLDRILLGAAMSEDEQRTFAGVLPMDDVESGAMGVAGRFAELLDRLKAAFHSFTQPRPVDDWREAVARSVDSLMKAPRGGEWQRLELDRVLSDLAEGAPDGERDPPTLTLTEFRALIQPLLEGRPTRANFRTGNLTVCTLMPMRSVPHRVVCLLGLDDGAFPRKTPRDGDDLLLAEPHLGDRDPRLEDRQLLLDALMAAREHLVITYKGNDERTNEVVPPAVPIAELLDVIDATVAHPDPARRASELIHIRHPLQGFDARNFKPLGPQSTRPWSFDRVNLAGAEALTSGPSQPPEFLKSPLSPIESGAIELDLLLRFTAHPVRAFLRQRLGIDVRDFFDGVQDSLPLELDSLGKWGVGNRLLAARRSGIDRERAHVAELARGHLPPGELARPVLDEVSEAVERIVAAVNDRVPEASRETLDVGVALSDDRGLGGSISGISGDTLLQVSFSRLKARERLSAWVKMLVLTAARPDVAWRAITFAKASKGDDCAVATVASDASTAAAREEWARGHLEVLVDLYERGMREPLPLYCSTSAAYAAAAAAGDDEPLEAARSAWDGSYVVPGEKNDDEHRLIFGRVSELEELLVAKPAADEGGAGWSLDEDTRFGRCSRRLWDGLLAHEQIDEV